MTAPRMLYLSKRDSYLPLPFGFAAAFAGAAALGAAFAAGFAAAAGFFAAMVFAPSNIVVDNVSRPDSAIAHKCSTRVSTSNVRECDSSASNLQRHARHAEP
jgi:hypothetical protein